jgi:hypothetical protein
MKETGPRPAKTEVLSALDRIRQRYRGFAETECRGYSDTYYRLALGAADDDAILSFIVNQPVIRPNLFFAAVKYLTGPADMPTSAAELRAVLNRRGGEVSAIMQTRRPQTNEVGRCSVLLPALPPGPLALVEVGASAGLCLLLDRFFYDYGTAAIGAASSPVRLRCTVTGVAPLPAAPPNVVWRRGLDRQPIDVYDDDAVRWLVACVWADHADRHQRLEAAIQLARADPAPVTSGDLVDDLPTVLAAAPVDARLVVFHSAVLIYVSQDRRDVFRDVLAETSRGREVVWISNEGAGVVTALAGRAPEVPELRFLVGRTTFREGMGNDELLALAHPHGGEMTWLSTSPRGRAGASNPRV